MTDDDTTPMADDSLPSGSGSGSGDGDGDGSTVTWRELHAETAARLARSNVAGLAGDGDGASVEARWLCETASGLTGAEWSAGQRSPAGSRAVARLDAMVARRVAGEPVQYVLGSWAFRRLDLMVDRRVLIPRPETEAVAERAITLAASMPAPRTVVDLGTGSGAIALAVADELPIGTVTVWATDVSADALDVARANVAGLGRAATAVRLAHGSWFDALPDELRGTIDVLVSNPPYVPDDDPALDASVLGWEPASALFAGADGLDAVRVLAAGAPEWLRPGGWLVVEIGTGQGAAAAALLQAAGLVEVAVRPDLAGHDRLVEARRAQP